MNIEKEFDFLIKKYGLKYAYQKFENCFGGSWTVYTHSFYNDSGCFTIHQMPDRGELSFYYAKKFSNILENLYEKMVNVYEVEKSIWDKHSKIWIFNNIFFWANSEKVLKVLAEVLKIHLEKSEDFFGIQIKK